jgi:hypothetical protein
MTAKQPNYQTMNVRFAGAKHDHYGLLLLYAAGADHTQTGADDRASDRAVAQRVPTPLDSPDVSRLEAALDAAHQYHALREITRCFVTSAGMTVPGELARVTGLSRVEGGLGNHLVAEGFATSPARGVYVLAAANQENVVMSHCS